MHYNAIITTSLQVVGDLFCVYYAFLNSIRKSNFFRTFFTLNSFAFLLLAFADTYYNYEFRIMHKDINESMGFVFGFPIFIFQLTQVYNWYFVSAKNNIKILSWTNFPYFLFTIVLILILFPYFLLNSKLSPIITWSQFLQVVLDILVWFFAIICLARTQAMSIALIATGSLMLVSADLTSCCLFMFEMDKVATSAWLHLTWTAGVLLMAIGFYLCNKKKDFEFSHPESLQAISSSWMLFTCFIGSTIGFIFLSFFNLTNFFDFYTKIWNIPVILMFIMIAAVLLGNWFSAQILSPVNYFLELIDRFNSGEDKRDTIFSASKIYEFKKLGNFITDSFLKLSTQLDREIKLANQVAHDIRSPLSALDLIVRSLSEVDETKRILLRDAINHIRDIINNLETSPLLNKNNECKVLTQIAILLGCVLSERKVALTSQNINITHNINPDSYRIFVEVVPSSMKRVLANIINTACEAVTSDRNIQLLLDKSSDEVMITISDQGAGIQENILPRIFSRGFSTKSKGKGLGLCYSKENIEKWGGKLTVTSTVGKGTAVCISLPAKSPPKWYVEKLSIPNNSSVICVDDCVTIWALWQEKMKHFIGKINLTYCQSRDAFLEKIEIIKHKSCVYLIDYEFACDDYTGIDLIDMLILKQGHSNHITSTPLKRKFKNFVF